VLKTPLHDWHAQNGGKMVDFAGWAMPVQYGSIVAEHNATRSAAGLFDVSHMGRVYFSGPEVDLVVDRLVTRKIAGAKVGSVKYGLVLGENGCALDDVLVYRLTDTEILIVVNASNRERLLPAFAAGIAGSSVEMTDFTALTAMIAVQGPQAIPVVASVMDYDISALRYYRFTALPKKSTLPETTLISRTGYTGEDGCEIILPASSALPCWEKLLASGARAVGLAARDTLRLEAGMPLYGHELSEEIDPLQAGLGFAVQLDDRNFLGKPALENRIKDESRPVRAGLTVEGPRPAREGATILSEEKPVGTVTSGTVSPTLQTKIAMGYVPPALSAVGTKLEVDIRGNRAAATVVPLPFYQRSAS
jgi:aminomethyltransferase